MISGSRKSGIDAIGDVPWSTHFGLFYRTRQDLVEVLVPYFVAGLKNNEFCMWVTAEPLNAEDAKACMASVLPDFDVYVGKGQIEIISYTEWYTIDNVFDGERVLNGWVGKLRKAQERGFSGLRLTGNESWLEPGVWKDFIDYEQTINEVIGQYEMLAVCSYSMDKCDANDILDVVSTHQFALTRRNGDWKVIEDQGQKNARKALQESGARLKVAEAVEVEGKRLFDVLETLPAMICLLTPDYHVAFANRSFREKFGESNGRHCYEYCFGLSEPCEFCESYEVLKTGQPHHWEVTGTDGSVIAAHDFPFTDVDGSPLILEMDIDITVQKNAEATLRNLNETLERRVSERTIELRKKQEELSEAKNQAEMYLDLMGHDISNMHQIAIGQLELGQDIINTNGKLEGEYIEIIDTSLESLWRSAKLIDNVRKLQKIRSNEVKNQEINLDEVLNYSIKQYHGLYPEKLIKVDYREGSHIVIANDLLQEVFTNLIGNAIKHTNGNKVDIEVKIEDVQDNGKKYHKVSIEDTGPGIPDEVKDKIFNRLQRGETKARGMGLGLYLVKSLVDSYNGRVWVEDRIKGEHTKGSRFVVMLPAIDY